MDIDATQALPLSDLDDETDEEILEGEKKEVAHLKVLCQKGFPLTLFPIYDGINLIGRDGTTCNVHIASKSLSKQHACIEVQGNTHLIYDKGSRNKTRRDKMFLTAEVRYELRHEESIMLADLSCEYIKVKDADKEQDNKYTASKEQNSDEVPGSEPSSDILMPTQPYNQGNNNGIKAFALGAPTLNYVEDSDAEDYDVQTPFKEDFIASQTVVGETPMVNKSEANTQYIPESDSDEEVVQPKTIDFNMSEPDIFAKAPTNVSDMPTQAYAPDEDSDATTEDGYDAKDLVDAPTLAVTPQAEEPTQHYTMDITPRKSAMKKPKPKPEDPTQVYAMDVESPEDARRIQSARQKGKETGDEDTVSEFGDNAPTQTFAPEGERITPRKITWGETLAMGDSDDDSDRAEKQNSNDSDNTETCDNEQATLPVSACDDDAPTQSMDDVDATPAQGKVACADTQIFDGETQILDVTHTPDKPGRGNVSRVTAEDATQIMSPIQAEATQILDTDTPTLFIKSNPTKIGKRKQTVGVAAAAEATQIMDTDFGDATQMLEAETPILNIKSKPTIIGKGKQTVSVAAAEATQIMGTDFGDATQMLEAETPILNIKSKPTIIGKGKQTISVAAAAEATQIMGTDFGDATQMLDTETPTLNIKSKPTRIGGKKTGHSTADATQIIGDATQIIDEPNEMMETQMIDDEDEEFKTPMLTITRTPTVPKVSTASTFEFNPQASSTQIRSAKVDEPTQLLGDVPDDDDDTETHDDEDKKESPVIQLIKKKEESLGDDDSTQAFDDKVDHSEDATLDFEMNLSERESGTSGKPTNSTQAYGSSIKTTRPDEDFAATQAYGVLPSDSEPSDAESEDMLVTDTGSKSNKKLTNSEERNQDFMATQAYGNSVKPAKADERNEDFAATQAYGVLPSNSEPSDAESEDMLGTETGSKLNKTANEESSKDSEPTQTFDTVRRSPKAQTEKSSSSATGAVINPDSEPTQTLDSPEKVETKTKTDSEMDTQTFEEKPEPAKAAVTGDDDATQAYGLEVDSDETEDEEEESRRESAVFGKTRPPVKPQTINTDDLDTQAYGIGKHANSPAPAKPKPINTDELETQAYGIHKPSNVHIPGCGDVVASSQMEDDAGSPTPLPDIGVHANVLKQSPATNRGRGRKSAAKVDDNSADKQTTVVPDSEEITPSSGAKTSQAEPERSSAAATETKTEASPEEKSPVIGTTAAPRRGRPKKVSGGDDAASSSRANQTSLKPPPAPRGRGRGRGASKEPDAADTKPGSRRSGRGRRSKVADDDQSDAESVKSEILATDDAQAAAPLKGTTVSTRRRASRSPACSREPSSEPESVKSGEAVPTRGRGRRKASRSPACSREPSSEPESVKSEAAAAPVTGSSRRKASKSPATTRDPSSEPESVNSAEAAPARGRGRRSKTNESQEIVDAATTNTRRSGRPKKPSGKVAADVDDDESSTVSEEPSTTRGRKRTNTKEAVKVEDEPVPVKRGRQTRGRVSAGSKQEEEDTEPKSRSRRGTGKSKPEPEVKEELVELSANEEPEVGARGRKTSGRGRKATAQKAQEEVAEAPEAEELEGSNRGRKGRGRPAKSQAVKEEPTEEADSEEMTEVRGRRGSGRGKQATVSEPPPPVVGKGKAGPKGKAKASTAVPKEEPTDESDSEEMAEVNNRGRRGSGRAKQATVSEPPPPVVGKGKAGPKGKGKASLAAPKEEPAEPPTSRGRKKRGASPSSQSSLESETARKRKRTGPTPPATPGTPATRRLGDTQDSIDPLIGSPSLRKRIITPRIMFTGVTEKSGSKIIKTLGGEVAESVEDCTHLITDQVRRTVKFLCGVARGIAIVDQHWLEASKEARTFVDSLPYTVNDPSSEMKFGFKLKDAIATAAEHRVLTGWKIHATKNVKPIPAQMKEIVKCAGGQYVATMPKKHDEHIVVISCEEDEALCKPAQAANLPVVSAEFILTGILRQEVNLIEHSLFGSTAGASESCQNKGARRGRKR